MTGELLINEAKAGKHCPRSRFQLKFRCVTYVPLNQQVLRRLRTSVMLTLLHTFLQA